MVPHQKSKFKKTGSLKYIYNIFQQQNLYFFVIIFSARTPIYTHVRETLKGLTIIRTYNAENTTEQQYNYYQDLHSSAFYTFLIANRAFGFWLDLICMFYTIGVIASIMLIGKKIKYIYSAR